MLSCQNLCVQQGTDFLWKNLNFSIASGERMGLFAPSGKGKTTLARVLAGWQQPTSGNVLLDGQALPTKGYCPVQLIAQHPEFTFNPWRTTGDSVRDAWNPDAESMRRLSIDPQWLQRHPHQLSGGELARIALLRALDPRTRYLIADEITAQLDPALQQSVWQYIVEISTQRKIGLLIISHQKPLLDALCADNFLRE